MSPLPDRLRRHADGDQHPTAPWYVVPADHMWFTRLASAAIVMQILRTINREYPRGCRADGAGTGRARG
jgi:hypothetical protein